MRMHKIVTSPIAGLLFAGVVLAVGMCCVAPSATKSGELEASAFRTTDLIVDNSTTTGTITVTTGAGQAALISTPRGASTDGNNLCAGGGCQSVAYNGSLSATGSTNTAFGLTALASDTTGYGNAAFGEASMTANTTGSLNTAVGQNALLSNSSGTYNTAIGQSAMAAMTTDVDNTAIGQAAMLSLVTGDGNTAVGVQALSTSTSTKWNVAIGLNALELLTSGVANTAIGYEANSAATSAGQNVAIGYSSLRADTTGGVNVAIGRDSLANLVSGTQNTAVGAFAGGGITTGSNNTIVGANIGSLAAGTASKIILSDGGGTAADQLWISPTAPTSVNHGSLGTGSTNSWGNVTSIGANTSVTLTFSTSGFPNLAWCQATTESGNQHVNVTRSKTAPVFSCVDNTAGTAANCVDFTYWCTGQ